MSPLMAEILEKIGQLDPEEQVRLREMLPVPDVANEEEFGEILTEEEMTALMKPNIRTPQEMIEAGMIGALSDRIAEDGAEWVNRHKAKRQKKLEWLWTRPLTDPE